MLLSASWPCLESTAHCILQLKKITLPSQHLGEYAGDLQPGLWAQLVLPCLEM